MFHGSDRGYLLILPTLAENESGPQSKKCSFYEIFYDRCRSGRARAYRAKTILSIGGGGLQLPATLAYVSNHLKLVY